MGPFNKRLANCPSSKRGGEVPGGRGLCLAPVPPTFGACLWWDRHMLQGQGWAAPPTPPTGLTNPCSITWPHCPLCHRCHWHWPHPTVMPVPLAPPPLFARSLLPAGRGGAWIAALALIPPSHPPAPFSCPVGSRGAVRASITGLAPLLHWICGCYLQGVGRWDQWHLPCALHPLCCYCLLLGVCGWGQRPMSDPPNTLGPGPLLPLSSPLLWGQG